MGPKGEISFSQLQVGVPIERNPSALSTITGPASNSNTASIIVNQSGRQNGNSAVKSFKVKATPANYKLYAYSHQQQENGGAIVGDGGSILTGEEAEGG